MLKSTRLLADSRLSLCYGIRSLISCSIRVASDCVQATVVLALCGLDSVAVCQQMRTDSIVVRLCHLTDTRKNTQSIYLSLSIVLSPSISRSEIKVQNIFQYVNKLCEKSKTKIKSRKNSINFGQNKKKKRS